MDPSQAAADWEMAKPRMLDRLVAPSSLAPSPSPLAFLNPKKLQTQAPFFKCPDWVGAPAKGLYLEVRKGVDVVDHLSIDEQPYYLFGRHQGVVDFVLEHPSISRVHFALAHHANGGVYIIDLGSGHGTAINKKRLEANKPTKLDVNSTLYTGASSRAYVLRDGAAQPTIDQAWGPISAPEERKRAREDDRQHVKDDGILAGWDAPLKKPAKRKQPDVIQCAHILLRHRDSKPAVDRHGNPIARLKPETNQALAAYKEEIILNLDGAGVEAKFRKIARRESDCASWKKGGDLGRLKKGDQPKEFEQVAFNLEIGEIGGPVETELGVHLILRTDLKAD